MKNAPLVISSKGSKTNQQWFMAVSGRIPVQGSIPCPRTVGLSVIENKMRPLKFRAWDNKKKEWLSVMAWRDWKNVFSAYPAIWLWLTWLAAAICFFVRLNQLSH